MIDSRELRIGNYVQGEGLSIPRLQVFSDGKTAITAYGIALVESGQLEGLQPIPLTPEILIACGFELSNDEPVNGYYKYGCMEHYPFDIFLNNENHCCVHFLRVAFIKHPQYLHQLQNAVHALTQTEIKYYKP